MKKLHIPAPGEGPKKDPTQLSDELWMGIFASLILIGCGWLFWILPQVNAQEEDPFAFVEDPQEREVVRHRTRFEDLVGEGRIDSVDWSDEQESVRAFETAPRQVTELACTARQDALRSGGLSEREKTALLARVERRSADAPWTCLTRLYLAEELPEESALQKGLAGFWREVESLEAHGRIMSQVVDDFRTSRARPESEGFYHWLRRCAMNERYGARTECRRLVRQLAPEQGRDILEMVLLHLGLEELPEEELLEAAAALAWLSEQGQPASWRVEETRLLPDYDVDLRLGALFSLCRLMNSPDELVQRRVIDHLGRVAGVGTRPANPHTAYRWRQTCRRSFGNPEEPEQPVPILGVLVAGEGEEVTTDYGLGTLLERGLCENPEDAPIWWCGADRWTGEVGRIHRVVSAYFAQSAYVQWYAEEELAEVMGTD